MIPDPKPAKSETEKQNDDERRRGDGDAADDDDGDDDLDAPLKVDRNSAVSKRFKHVTHSSQDVIQPELPVILDPEAATFKLINSDSLWKDVFGVLLGYYIGFSYVFEHQWF